MVYCQMTSIISKQAQSLDWVVHKKVLKSNLLLFSNNLGRKKGQFFMNKLRIATFHRFIQYSSDQPKQCFTVLPETNRTSQ